MELSTDLVRRLVTGQFPQWAELPISPVARQGNDNRTFRLGDQLALRLPSHERYVSGISKEDRVLPVVAKYLSVPIPVPVATGRPTDEYPYPWSVRHWLRGETPDSGAQVERVTFARELGAFLRELRAVPALDGPLAGSHSFFRGCHPTVYGDQVQQALLDLKDQVDVEACQQIWSEAVRSAWSTAPVWFHGDVAVGNLLIAERRLSAVIDFGTCGVGDPACDLVIAWTVLRGEERRIFREEVGLPDDTWARARGWALWKALITVRDPENPDFATQAHALAELLQDAVNT